MKESLVKSGLSFIYVLCGALLFGALISSLEPGGFNLGGFLGAGGLLWITLSLLLILWRWSGKERRPGLMILTAFAVRIVVGIGLSLALPVFGHDTPTSQAGYIFLDAFRRDAQAWDLAQSGQSLLAAFGDEFYGDQYGGMLALSAFIYRVFSPDSHRQWLIIIATSFSAAAGVVFLYRGLIGRFGQQVAGLAAWIYVLYPESILLGGAQMRDPILIALAAVAFWGVSTWQENRWRALFVTLITLLVMAAFSWLVALPVSGILLLWWWIEFSSTNKKRWLHWGGWSLAIIAVLTGLLIFGAWLSESAAWDARLTAQGSGWIQNLFTTMPAVLHTPFLLVYGIAQPVLPAAIFDPSLPLWNGIATFRSLGWYILLPVLFYVPFALRRTPASVNRRLVFLTFIVVIFWIFLSSYRAGGDLWDNPRYRTLLIPWLALIVAWGWTTGRQLRDAWLGRWYLIEGIFLIVFGLWYANRSYQLGLNIPFWGMVASIVGASTMVIIVGFLYDLFKNSDNVQATKIHHLDQMSTIRSVRLVFMVGALTSIASLILPLGFLGVSEPWFEFLRLYHRILPGLSAVIFLMGLGFSYTRLWTRIASFTEKMLISLNKQRWVAIAIIFLLSLALPIFQIYAQTFIKVRPYLPPFLIFSLCVLVSGLVWWSFRPAKGVQRGLAAGTLISAFVYLLALQLPRLTNYPFSIEWSEGSRIYEASQVYAQIVYGVQLPLPLLDVGRGLLQGLLFLIPGLSIGFHRSWLLFLELGTTFLAVFLIARRSKISDRLVFFLFIIYGILFLYQGPIFHHLLVIVFLVMWRFDAQNPWKSLIWVVLSSVWAGLTRINWFPVAGCLAALLYLLAEPVGKRIWVKYISAPVAYIVVGSLTAFATYFGYIAISGNPADDFGTSLSSVLLWERLWPNTSFSLGILPGIILVSLPILGMTMGRIIRSKGGWHPLRLAGILSILIVFLGGGIIVSVKIGGGNNLHNLDAYLYLLLVSGSLVLFGQFTPDQPARVKTHHWSALWLAFLILVPVGFALTTPLMKKLPEERITQSTLQKLQRSINRVAESGKPILFMGNRQLIAFKQVHGVEIFAPYERIVISEMAMANNQTYLNQFYKDLAEHRFALIVMEPMNLQYQDETYRFAFENNLFVDTIFKPVNEYYQEDVILRAVGISTFRPRR